MTSHNRIAPLSVLFTLFSIPHRGHAGHILCVQTKDDIIVSGSEDKSIKVWNYEGECVNELVGHTDAVTCVQFHQQSVISGSFDFTIKFWDTQNGVCIRTIDWICAEGHTRIVRYVWFCLSYIVNYG